MGLVIFSGLKEILSAHMNVDCYCFLLTLIKLRDVITEIFCFHWNGETWQIATKLNFNCADFCKLCRLICFCLHKNFEKGFLCFSVAGLQNYSQFWFRHLQWSLLAFILTEVKHSLCGLQHDALDAKRNNILL